MEKNVVAPVKEEKHDVSQVDPEVERLAQNFLRPQLSLEDYLHQLEKRVANLSLVPQALTIELFKNDRPKFEETISKFEHLESEIEAVLVTFETRVLSEWPRPPVARRFFLWLVQVFLSRANFKIEISNLHKCKAYLAAVPKFRKLIESAKKSLSLQKQKSCAFTVNIAVVQAVSKNENFIRFNAELEDLKVDFIKFERIVCGERGVTKGKGTLFELAEKHAFHYDEYNVRISSFYYKLKAFMENNRSVLQNKISAIEKGVREEVLREMNLPLDLFS